MLEKVEAWFGGLSPFFKVAVLVISAVFMFGVFGPSMISAKSTFAVWIGIAVLIGYSWLAYRLGRPVFDELLKELK